MHCFAMGVAERVPHLNANTLGPVLINTCRVIST